MLRRLFERLIESRQRAADREVARLLHRSEFPYENYSYVYSKVSRRDLF